MGTTPAPRCYRRRGPVFLECGDQLWLDPLQLFRGQLVPQRLPLLRAYAPPASAPIEIDGLAAACLASLTAGTARALPDWLSRLDDVGTTMQHLIDSGLVEPIDVEDDDASAALSPALLDDWFGPAAFYHYASRWSGVVARDEVPIDATAAASAFEASRVAFEQQTRARGTPPTHRPDRGDVSRALAMPRHEPKAFDILLSRRETHRLFDDTTPLALTEIAQLLHRSFAATGVAPLGGGLSALRKHTPSGGGMHPVEAYPLIVDVEGVEPGWYHYRACGHQLAPIQLLSRDAARQEIGRLAAGQHYFTSASMLVALTLRFPRHHWKYPQHGRAYRVMLLEAGHIGQTFYLAATEAGLGAFFTAAINDVDIDAALGLDGIDEGCIALVGCGRPAADGGALRLSRYVVPD